jgi:hypothetical protein
MGERRRWVLTASALALAIAVGVSLSCRHRAYRGDGTFEDHGWYSGSDRYRLDLGSIDFATAGVHQYSFGYLPAEHFTLGFEVAHSTVRIDRDLPINPRVRLELKSRSDSIINEQRPLAKWILSTGGGPALLYCGRPEGTGWDRTPGTAWGCHFTPPDAKQQYTLRVEVIEPDPRARGYDARLIIQGGPPDFLP